MVPRGTKMVYWLDTEFIENGGEIHLLSIGIVAEDGLSFYAVHKDCDISKASPWVKDNVLKYIDFEDEKSLKTKAQIKESILTMTRDDSNIRFVADYCSYDWVALCQIFGAMIDLPKNFPMYCNDLQQLLRIVGLSDKDLPKDNEKPHHALADAMELKTQWEFAAKEFEKKFGKKLKI